MDLHVNETVKEYLLTISKKYEFEYMFRGEKFGLVNNLNVLKTPVLVLPPENNDKYAGKMRLWAYGGSIADVDTKNGLVKLSNNKMDYVDYLGNGFRIKKKHPEEFWQEGLFDDLDDAADQEYIRLIREHDRSSGVINKELLDLSVFAAYTRYMNRNLYKTYPSYPQEKSMKCVIAKNSMLNSKYMDNGASMVVIDVETHLFNKNKKHPRADFVVFDGKTFGLIEFKYLGQSMDSKENNLKKHYEDFCTALTPQIARGLFEELKIKLKYLASYGLIDESWQDKCKEMCSRKYDESVLWCGFYFLGDATDIPGKRKKIVTDRIKSQLKPIYGKIKARCQISGINPDHIDDIRMDMIDISEVWRGYGHGY